MNPELSVEIENKVREAMGIPLLPTAGGAAPADEAKPAKKAPKEPKEARGE